jgi:urease accessory protein UreE
VAETIDRVVGYISDPVISEKLHNLSHQGTVEYVVIEQKDTLRRRIRIQSDCGTECLVAIPRNQTLFDGALLLLEKDRAIVIREHRKLSKSARVANRGLYKEYKEVMMCLENR